MTIVINMRDGLDEKKIKVAARLILEGGKLVAFPTETVYGLGGADALNEGGPSGGYSRPKEDPRTIL